MTAAGHDPSARPRLLLSGDAGARPDGLERALTRAGFQLSEESEDPERAERPLGPPDALLTTLADADDERLRRLMADVELAPPRIVVTISQDRQALAAALALGAADALAAPVHLPELCARIAARIRNRQAPARTPYEARVRESLRALVDGARTLLLPDEVALALVRRLGRALELAHCSYVLVGPGDDQGRIIADTDDGRADHARLDLTRYPEIQDAIRSRRIFTLPDIHAAPTPGHAGTATVDAARDAVPGAPRAKTVVVPVVIDDEVAGVLLMRGHEPALSLSATQLELAGDLAVAAARALDGGPRRLTPPTLERRLHEELERARRYSLGFSVVLLDVPVPDEDGREDEEATARRRQATVGQLRREFRLPDYVSGYADGRYVIVLPETGPDGARRAVQRLRERLDGAGAGIVSYPHPSVAEPDDLFVLVEAALRRGQAQGGERIGVAN